uniref:Uncharacterized protein n=1 Tax=Anguilla anguilla TaxID=7936 RepID=A0A0E9X9N7_ANGAN
MSFISFYFIIICFNGLSTFGWRRWWCRVTRLWFSVISVPGPPSRSALTHLLFCISFEITGEH